MQKAKILNCAYSFDDNYAQHGGLSMLSLFENNKEADEINVYILDNHIGKTNCNKIEQIANQYGRKVIFVDLDKLTEKMNVVTNFNRSSYGRLFLTQFKEVDLMLYIDSDTIVTGSLLELLDVDMTNMQIAGVQDTLNPYFIRKTGLKNEDRYINGGGVILLNLKEWRKSDLEEKCLDYVFSFEGNPPFDDQGTLNHVCKDHVRILPPEYNLMPPMYQFSVKKIKRLFQMKTYYSQEEVDFAIQHPKVIHFTAEFYNRPWFKNCTHPMKRVYVDYLTKSPWSDSELTEKEMSKNCRIQNWIYTHCPFFVYLLMVRFIHVRHILRDIL